MAEGQAEAKRDFVNDRLTSFLLWKAPALVMVATGLLEVGMTARGLVWAACLTTLGGGCFANALRCGRVHCYITGPFFLLMALASLLHGFRVVSLGPLGWLWIAVVTIVGALTLTYVPEWIWGRYVERKS
jgi:hypothetical protein